jgi:hypothetical protein
VQSLIPVVMGPGVRRDDGFLVEQRKRRKDVDGRDKVFSPAMTEKEIQNAVYPPSMTKQSAV